LRAGTEVGLLGVVDNVGEDEVEEEEEKSMKSGDLRLFMPLGESGA